MKKAGIIITIIVCALIVAAGVVIVNNGKDYVDKQENEVTETTVTTTVTTTQTDEFNGVSFGDSTENTEETVVTTTVPLVTAPKQNNTDTDKKVYETMIPDETRPADETKSFWDLMNEGAKAR